ncbi:MAG: 4-(cytidine 5'-diphospho)-2-C-methyl-D-erythritol kinase [Christensenellales bacterium]|jgi:4-diphosphocytidyl-2-C-methyl-D-erythritol kinase
MRILARAKINWALSVQGIDPRGYHLLRMINDSVSLADVIELKHASQDVTVGSIPDVSMLDNVVYKAATLLKERFGIRQGVRIEIEKRIPLAAGLAGGSTNAAATLIGLNELWQIGLGLSELAELALEIGADVPYCLYGGRRRVAGVGERVAHPLGGPMYHLVIAKERGVLYTPQVFAAYDQNPVKQADADAIAKALASGDMKQIRKAMVHANDLQDAACALDKNVQRVISRVMGTGAVAAWVSGSGPAVVGLYQSEDAQQAAVEELKNKVFSVYAVVTEKKAVEMI